MPKDKRQNKLADRPTKLKAHMIRKKMTVVDLHRKIREMYPDDPVSRTTLTHIYKGQKGNYQIFTLYRIMNATGLSPNELLEWEENVIS